MLICYYLLCTCDGNAVLQSWLLLGVADPNYEKHSILVQHISQCTKAKCVRDFIDHY